METRVGSITERHRLVFVLQEVLDVAHLMVHRDQVIHRHNSALFDPGDTNKANIPCCLLHLQQLHTGNCLNNDRNRKFLSFDLELKTC